MPMPAPARNEALGSALDKFSHVPGFVEGICAVLGIEGRDALTGTGEVTVTGFHLDPGDSVFAVHLVTTGRYSLFELGATGDTFSVTIPASRVRRVVESTISGAVTVVVELDAYQSTTTINSEYVEGAVETGDGDQGVRTSGRSVSQAVTEAANFTLRASDPDEITSLRALAGAARSLLDR